MHNMDILSYTSGMPGVGFFTEKNACRKRNRAAVSSQGLLRGSLPLRTRDKTCGREEQSHVLWTCGRIGSVEIERRIKHTTQT